MVDAVSCITLRTGQLERHGVILRAGLTPTDILHASGEINLWNRKAAREAVQLYALRAGMEEQEFITHVWDAFAYRFGAHFFYTVYEKERLVIDRKKFSKDLAALIVNQSEKMRISTHMDDPIVLIGAPAEMYRRYISAYIDGKIVVPPYHQIAGAVDAITGMVSETVIILIRPTQKGGFIAFTPLSRMYFSDLAEAKEKMVQWANSYIQERAESAGAAKPHIKVVTTDHKVDFIGRDTIYLETTITAHASGIPQV